MLCVTEYKTPTRVRKDWECETGMTVEADFLLYDICQAIGLDDAETQRIIGAVPLAVIEAAITNSRQNGF